MSLAAFAVLAVLSQTPDAPAASAEERATLAAARAAEAAQKASEAAQKAAEAVQRLAEYQAKLAGVEEKKPDAPKPSAWSGGLGVGLMYLTGNANALTFSAMGSAQRKTEKWILGAKLWGAYGMTNVIDKIPQYEPDGTPQVGGDGRVVTKDETRWQDVAWNAGISAQIDFRVVEKVTILVAGGLDTDHIKSVELRGFGEIGAGVLWLDKKEADFQKLFLRTDLTFRVQPEIRYDYYVDPVNNPRGRPFAEAERNSLLVAPRAALQFRYALNKATAFQEDMEVMPNVVGATAGRVLFNSTSKLSVRIVENVALAASFQLKYDSIPARGNVTTDTVTTVSVEAVF